MEEGIINHSDEGTKVGDLGIPQPGAPNIPNMPLALPPPKAGAEIPRRAYGKSMLGAVVAVAVIVVLVYLMINSRLISIPGTYVITTHPNTTNTTKTAATYANYDFASPLPNASDFILLFNSSYSSTGINSIYVKSYALPFAVNLTSPASDLPSSYVFKVPLNSSNVTFPIAFEVFAMKFQNSSASASFYHKAYVEQRNLTINSSSTIYNSTVDGLKSFVFSNMQYSTLRYVDEYVLYNNMVISVGTYGNLVSYNSSYTNVIAAAAYKLLS